MKSRLQFDHLVIAAALFVGFITGGAQLYDNSMLVHIRTGMLILDSHRVPHSDPYSFTAPGHSWTVQSWFAEVVYAGLIKIGGGHLLQFFNALLYAAVAGIIAKLSRTNDLARTLFVTVVSIGIGYSLWAPRPTMFAALFFAVTVLVVVRRRSPLWLVPIGLLWVNSHGTWALALGWLVAAAVGAALDRSDWKTYARYLFVLAASVLVGGLASPAGAGILTFPLSGFGSHAKVFANIVEWKSPNFASTDVTGGRLVLLCFLGAIVGLARSRTKWQDALPVLLLIAASLDGVRNLTFLGVALAPVLAGNLIGLPKALEPGTRRILIIGMTAFVLCGALSLVPVYEKSAYGFGGYPVDAIKFMEANQLIGPGHHVAAPDFVGCYLIYEKGSSANVFIDDRYDMYPVDVANDAFALSRLGENADEVLNRWNVDAVVYQTKSPLVQYLAIDPAWQQRFRDDNWVVYSRR